MQSIAHTCFFSTQSSLFCSNALFDFFHAFLEKIPAFAVTNFDTSDLLQRRLHFFERQLHDGDRQNSQVASVLS